MATIGALTLVKTGFVVYKDMADLVGEILVDISTNLVEHQGNPNLPPFFNETVWDYKHRISPLLRSFLTTPMFEVMLESNVPLCSVHRTIADVTNRVQAKEWMPPLSSEDRKVHKKACTDLDREQVDDRPMPDHHKQYGENDPLPLVFRNIESTSTTSPRTWDCYTSGSTDTMVNNCMPSRSPACVYSGRSPALVKKRSSWPNGCSHSATCHARTSIIC